MSNSQDTKTDLASKQCVNCALQEHGAYFCARWRMAYQLNEWKKKIPIVRRGAVLELRCPFYWKKETGA